MIKTEKVSPDAPARAGVLTRAYDLTMGPRHEDYGDPFTNHQHIANIFNAITGRDLSAREIVLVLQSVKLARRAKNPLHRDSYDDGAAYTGIEYECAVAECAVAECAVAECAVADGAVADSDRIASLGVAAAH